MFNNSPPPGPSSTLSGRDLQLCGITASHCEWAGQCERRVEDVPGCPITVVFNIRLHLGLSGVERGAFEMVLGPVERSIAKQLRAQSMVIMSQEIESSFN